MITFGTSFVGKVDRVAGKCYVVTKAFQIINIPLLPLGGYLVEEGTETQTFVSGLTSFSGSEIAMSWKSFAWGIARAVLFGGGLLTFMCVTPILLGLSGVGAILGGPVLGVAMLVTWWKTRRGLAAKPERVREIETLFEASRAGLPSARVVGGSRSLG